jgi:hypothetical protein
MHWGRAHRISRRFHEDGFWSPQSIEAFRISPWKPNMYAVTAGAAGVSILALARPSNAKIVDTKADVVMNDVVMNEDQHYTLDLNLDDVIDFTIANRDFR